MIQSGGILPELITAIQQARSLAGKVFLKKGILLAGKFAPKLAEKATKYHIIKGINELNKSFTSSKGPGKTLAINEIKNVLEVIKSLENRGILLKGTTKKY